MYIFITKKGSHDRAHVVLLVQGYDQLKCDIGDIGGQERDGVGQAKIEHLHGINKAFERFIGDLPP